MSKKKELTVEQKKALIEKVTGIIEDNLGPDVDVGYAFVTAFDRSEGVQVLQTCHCSGKQMRFIKDAMDSVGESTPKKDPNITALEGLLEGMTRLKQSVDERRADKAAEAAAPVAPKPSEEKRAKLLKSISGRTIDAVAIAMMTAEIHKLCAGEDRDKAATKFVEELSKHCERMAKETLEMIEKALNGVDADDESKKQAA